MSIMAIEYHIKRFVSGVYVGDKETKLNLVKAKVFFLTSWKKVV